MRGKRDCTQAWVSLKTLLRSGKAQSRSRNRVSSHCHRWRGKKKKKKRFAECDFKRGFEVYSSDACGGKTKTRVWPSRRTLKLKVCAFLAAGPGSVWPPVFTHKRCNLQSDPAVWVRSPVSHSPIATRRHHKHRLRRAASRRFPASL